MKMTQTNLTVGMFERRPSASKTPMGSDATIPTTAITSVTSKRDYEHDDGQNHHTNQHILDAW